MSQLLRQSRKFRCVKNAVFYEPAASAGARGFSSSSAGNRCETTQQYRLGVSSSVGSLPIKDKVNRFLGGSRNYMWSNHWFSSSASPQPSEKEANGAVEPDNNPEDASGVENIESAEANGDSTPSDVECDLSHDELLKLVAEKDELLDLKKKEVEEMNDKVLRTFAEMENVIERTKRESENTKKFAIQNFAKGLLDVADNLGRASSVVKESFAKIDQSKDSVGAVPLIKTLLDGVEMTDKQLAEVFKKFGVEKFDPLNENFDPNRHMALYQIPDASKPPGIVGNVLKPGYTLHDRVIRPAEVGVTEALKEHDVPISEE